MSMLMIFLPGFIYAVPIVIKAIWESQWIKAFEGIFHHSNFHLFIGAWVNKLNRICKLSSKERTIILATQFMASNLRILNSYAIDKSCHSGYGKEDENEEYIKKFVIRSTWITF